MAKRRNKTCHWCKRPLQKSTAISGLALTQDHVVPKSLGGGATVDCCRACNSLKGGMTPREWHDFMAANPKWWTLYQPRYVTATGILQQYQAGFLR